MSIERDNLRELRIRCHLSLAQLAEKRGQDDAAEYNIDVAFKLIRERPAADVQTIVRAKAA